MRIASLALMVKGCVWAVAAVMLLIVGSVVYYMSSSYVQRNTVAYKSMPIILAAKYAANENGRYPQNLHEALQIYRKKVPDQAARADAFLERYKPIVMVQWTKSEFGLDLWIKPTENCAPGWISVRDGENNLKDNQHPPSDAVYLWVPGSPKP